MSKGIAVLLVLAAACGSSEPCPVQPLFQIWRNKSFTAKATGAQPVPSFNLTSARYGSTIVSISPCSYEAQIVATSNTFSTETGNITLSNPSPASGQCVVNATASTYALTCDSLTVSNTYGTGVYTP